MVAKGNIQINGNTLGQEAQHVDNPFDPEWLRVHDEQTKAKNVGCGLTDRQKALLLDNVPENIRSSACDWFFWKYGDSRPSGSRKKIPHDVDMGCLADINDVGGSLNQAITACSFWKGDGVGYSVIPTDHLVGWDFDNCFDPITGTIDDWADEIIQELDSYTEVTPSQKGVRVWTEGRLSPWRNRKDGFGVHKKGGLEVYSRNRFFTVTGNHVAGTPRNINHRQAAISHVYETIFGQEPSRLESLVKPTPAIPNNIIPDAELIKKACAAKEDNGELFQRLWEGKWEGDYPSQSDADMPLCGMLAFWTRNNAEQMDRLFRKSGLIRAKWDAIHYTNGDTYGQRTIRKAITNNKATYGGRQQPSVKPVSGDGVVCLADVIPQKVQWLWRGWIPKGKLTLLESDPGLGKSLLTLSLAASITAGKPLPDGSYGEQGTVLLTNAEDAGKDTVIPRLQAAGANLTFCNTLRYSSEEAGERLLDIPNNLNELADAMHKYRPVLVVVDPLIAFFSKDINSWKDQDVRRALAPLAKLAEQTGSAIVLIRHLNKKEDVKNPIYRGGGSIGFIGAVRSALSIQPEPGSERRILSTIKCNLAAPATPLIFTVEEEIFTVEEENDSTLPYIQWHGEQTRPQKSISSNQSLKSTKLDDAKEFLQESLSKGALKANEVMKSGVECGFTVATIRRAKEALNIESVRVDYGDDGHFLWKLPIKQ